MTEHMESAQAPLPEETYTDKIGAWHRVRHCVGDAIPPLDIAASHGKDISVAAQTCKSDLLRNLASIIAHVRRLGLDDEAVKIQEIEGLVQVSDLSDADARKSISDLETRLTTVETTTHAKVRRHPGE